MPKERSTVNVQECLPRWKRIRARRSPLIPMHRVPPCFLTAALLQQKANNLALFDGLTGKALTDTIGVYENVFQVSHAWDPYSPRLTPAHCYSRARLACHMRFLAT